MKGPRTDLRNIRFGRLIALEPICPSSGGYIWKCICDCGKEHQATVGNLKAGIVKSCGCLRGERHGRGNTNKYDKTYRSWAKAKSRCNNPKDPKYRIYGARGIKMCSAWSESFTTFLHDMGDAPAGKTIDRINVNGNYEPGNCRWATPSEQAQNLRTTRFLTLHTGERVTVTTAARMYGVRRGTICEYFRRKGHDATVARLASGSFEGQK